MAFDKNKENEQEPYGMPLNFGSMVMGVGLPNMHKLCIFIGVTVFGWVGWWMGDKIGFTTGFVLSVIGSIAGVYIGWRINRDYLT